MVSKLNKPQAEQAPSPGGQAAQTAARLANPVSASVFVVALILASLVGVAGSAAGWPDAVVGGAAFALLLAGVYVLFALKIANQWEKAVVLRFGKFRGLFGPGLF